MQRGKNKTFLAVRIYIKCSCAPSCLFFFALIVPAAPPRGGAIHDEFLLAEPCKYVTVGDVLKYLAADKCNEGMNKWMDE